MHFDPRIARRRLVASLLVLGMPLFVVASAQAATPIQDEVDLPHDIAAGKALLNEGNALADKGDTAEAQNRYKLAFEQLLPSLRQLPFRREVKGDMTDRSALGSKIIEDIDREMTPAEFRAYESGLKALGFLDPDVDLKQLLGEVYGQEIGAFYDPRTDTMHLIRESEKGGRKPTFLETLMGKKAGFDKDESQTVIAHEMTHALADQHFDLETMLKSVKDDTDRELATVALIEGEATLAMTVAQSKDWEGRSVRDLPAEQMGQMVAFLGPLMPSIGGSAALKKAPEVIKESMLFPYLQGLVFNLTLTNEKGWKGVDSAYRKPPLSTEQVLHPEKYAKALDTPRDFTFKDLPAPEGWTELGQDVVGELQASVLLRPFDGRTAAAGWDGDRFAVFAHGDEARAPLAFVWRSVWDTEADAIEFATAYASFQSRKLGPSTPKLTAPLPDLLGRSGPDGARFLVERRGSDVVIVEGFGPEPTSRLVEAAFAASCFDKK
jgi:hypothetical protein